MTTSRRPALAALVAVGALLAALLTGLAATTTTASAATGACATAQAQATHANKVRKKARKQVRKLKKRRKAVTKRITKRTNTRAPKKTIRRLKKKRKVVVKRLRKAKKKVREARKARRTAVTRSKRLCVRGTTTRVSVDSSGGQGWAHSFGASISGNDRYVAFASASNLVAGDTNGLLDVYVRDRLTGTTERVSVASNGAQANGQSQNPSISADGRYVAFESIATNLASGSTGGVRQIYLHDRRTRRTTLVSRTSTGTPARGVSPYYGDSQNPSVSANGRYVAFDSWATNLASGNPGGLGNIYRHDRATGRTVLVSVKPGSARGNSHAANPSISADGNLVAFDSAATNWGRDRSSVYLRNVAAGTTALVSVRNNGNPVTAWTAHPSLSADGSTVAFEVTTTSDRYLNRNPASLYVRHLPTRRTRQLPGTVGALAPDLSRTGRWTAFAAAHDSASPQIRVYDWSTGSVSSVSGPVTRTFITHWISPSISDDGTHVAFTTPYAGLVPGDTNREDDVFVRHR